jgi:serine/threonine protein kinase
MDLRVGNKYRAKKRLGAGSFGEIYSGENMTTHEEVAIKLESVRAKPHQLAIENKVYRSLSGAVGVPHIKWFGTEGDYNVLVMDLLGRSLEDLFQSCQRKFSRKTILMLADQMLARIEYVHDKGYLHRDVKPDNFMIGTGHQSNTVFVIDFGLSKKWRNSKTLQHIPFRDGKTLTGTARYSSINTHLGIEQSRRDDIEAIAYVLVYLSKGSLPWMGVHVDDHKQQNEVISERKIATNINILCEGLPPEFALFLSEIRKLDFADRPQYALYRQLFRNVFVREGFVYDYLYDWLRKPLPTISLLQCLPMLSVEDAEKPARPTPPMHSRPENRNAARPVVVEGTERPTLPTTPLIPLHSRPENRNTARPVGVEEAERRTRPTPPLTPRYSRPGNRNAAPLLPVPTMGHPAKRGLLVTPPILRKLPSHMRQ